MNHTAICYLRFLREFPVAPFATEQVIMIRALSFDANCEAFKSTSKQSKTSAIGMNEQLFTGRIDFKG